MTLLDADSAGDRFPEEPTLQKFGTLASKLVALLATAGDLRTAGIGGGLLFIEQFVAPLFRKRQVDFFNDLVERIGRLEARIDHIDEAGIERLVESAVGASLAAAKSRDETKRDALLNAVVNSALPGAPDEVQRQMYFSLIDQYTGLHLALLDMFHNPVEWKSPDDRLLDKQNARSFVWSMFPRMREELIQGAWADLFHDGLVTTPVLDNGAEGRVVTPRTTPYGRALLEFIRRP